MESSHGPTVPDFGEKITTKPNRKMSNGTAPLPLPLAVPEQDQLPHFTRLLPARVPGQAQTVSPINLSFLCLLLAGDWVTVTRQLIQLLRSLLWSYPTRNSRAETGRLGFKPCLMRGGTQPGNHSTLGNACVRPSPGLLVSSRCIIPVWHANDSQNPLPYPVTVFSPESL